jgi:hypothetical protein
MSRRLAAYERAGVYAEGIPLRFNRSTNRYTDIGVDVRIGLDLVRWGVKGLYDVAIIVGEDSDLNEAAKDVNELRDHERWIALENALPWSPNSHSRWLADVRRQGPIDKKVFDQVVDRRLY